MPYYGDSSRNGTSSSSYAFSPDNVGQSSGSSRFTADCASGRAGGSSRSYSSSFHYNSSGDGGSSTGQYERYFGGRDSAFAPHGSYSSSYSPRDSQGYYSSRDSHTRHEYGASVMVGSHRNECYSRYHGGSFAPEGSFAHRERDSFGGDRLAQAASSYRRGSTSHAENGAPFGPDSYDSYGTRYHSTEAGREEGRGSSGYSRYFGNSSSSFVREDAYGQVAAAEEISSHRRQP